MQERRKWIPAFVVVAFALLCFLATQLSPSRNPEGGKNPAEAEIVQVDDFLVALNAATAVFKTAQTTLQKDEAKAATAGAADQFLRGKVVEAVAVLRDVMMVGSDTARLTFSRLEIPKFGQAPTQNFSLLSIAPVDLPMSQDVARTLVPGNRIVLRGVAEYHPGNMVMVIIPRLHAFLRLHYPGPGQEGAVITFSPASYAIVVK